MTKTLTEQWKNGKLTFGKMYWCCDKEKNIARLVSINRKFFEWDIATEVTKDVKEVLAPVPNYKEFQRLQEQLKEANEVIKTTNRMSGNIDLSQLVYEDRRKIDGITIQTESYLERWGIK